MFNKNTLLTGVVLATALGITFTSCKKDDDAPTPPAPRSKTFDLKGTGADKDTKVGSLVLTENTDSSVNVVLNLTKNTKDAVHNVFLIGGTPVTPTKDTLYNKPFTGTGAAQAVKIFENVKSIKVSKASGPQRDTAFKYDNALAIASHIKVLKGTDTLAIGLFGKTN